MFAVAVLFGEQRPRPWIEVKAYYVTEKGVRQLYDENPKIDPIYINNFEKNRRNFLVIELLNLYSDTGPFSGKLVVIRYNGDQGLEVPVFYLPAGMDKPDYLVIPTPDHGQRHPEAPPHWYWKEYGNYKQPILGRRWGADTQPTN
ncbi:MAG: hypothetical protein JSR80_08195 [Verrucomicrobia bacterium]|nr:hypothetical protein [Verrucomicrobiota bacterium]